VVTESHLREIATDPSLKNARSNKSLRSGQIRVIDTPGLGDRMDYVNMKKWWNEVKEFKINCALLCIDYNTRQNDSQMIEMIMFYRLLLEPLAEEGNIIVVVTRTPGIDYRESYSEIKRVYLDMCSKLLGRNVTRVEIVDTKDPLMKTCLKKSITRILCIARGFEGIQLNPQIPLLPDDKIKVPLVLQLLEEKRKRLDSESKLGNLWDLKKQLSDELDKKLEEKKTKGTRRKTPSLFYYGNHIIGFGERISNQLLDFPKDTFNCSFHTNMWNCGVTYVWKEDSPQCIFEVTPDFLCLSKKEFSQEPNQGLSTKPKRWFLHVWGEYFTASEEELLTLSNDINQLQHGIKMLDDKGHVETKLGKERNQLEQYQKLLRQDKFSLDKIDEVLMILGNTTKLSK